jgi:hypothetical protein
MQRRRLMGVLRWSGTVVAAGAFVLAALTAVLNFWILYTPTCSFYAVDGALQLSLGTNFRDQGGGWQGPSIEFVQQREALPWFLPHRDRWGPFVEYSLPLWVPLVVCGLPAGLAWRRIVHRRRRASVGLCSECGYERRGLVGGADTKCPECGTVPARG